MTKTPGQTELTGLDVSVTNVVKHYGETGLERPPVIRNLSLTVTHGEWVALMGDSGSGKSTLLNLLAGIDTPNAGEIQIGGESIILKSEKERTLFRREHMGFVFQFFNLFPTLSVLENVLLPTRLLHLDKNLARGQALSLLGEVGLSGKEHRFPSQLSGGEQQRVAIVRAVIHRPRLILADEPTGSLDHDTGDQILALLKKLHERDRPTIIMTTHSLHSSLHAQRTIRIRDGQIIDQDQDQDSAR